MRRAIAFAVVAYVFSAGPGALAEVLFHQGSTPPSEGIPAGGPYVPPGTLYDNEQSDGTTSLASQDSSAAGFVVRTADDFTIPGAGCDSGLFDITQIRIQMVQSDAAPQPFAVDLFDDNGSGTAPTPAGAITPIGTFSETSQASLGPFGIGTSIFEAAFDTTGLQLTADTVYWISGYGATAALNPSSFNNFFAASAGAGATTDNGVIIAPGAGVTSWTPVQVVIGGAPLAFSFAVDGACFIGAEPPFDPGIPTLSPIGIGLLAVALALLSLYLLTRHRRES